MINILNKITELKKELSKYRPLNETELKVIRENFAIENTYNSNAIEGNSLTLNETVLLLKDGVTVAEKPINDYLDMIGYKEAFDYIYDLARDNTPLSEYEIKSIHSLVLSQDNKNKGIYRSLPVMITGSNHTPPQPYLIKPKIEQLLLDYEEWKKDKHIIECIALFHLDFESIHPFIDGNGRTGRLILNLDLIRNGYLPINIKFTNRADYYNAFNDYRKVEGTKDPKAMVQLIAEYELKELEERISILKNAI